MNELFTLLNSRNAGELEATFWLSVFDELPDAMFRDFGEKPSAKIVEILKQYARAYTVMGNDGIVLN